MCKFCLSKDFLIHVLVHSILEMVIELLSLMSQNNLRVRRKERSTCLRWLWVGELVCLSVCPSLSFFCLATFPKFSLLLLPSRPATFSSEMCTAGFMICRRLHWVVFLFPIAIYSWLLGILIFIWSRTLNYNQENMSHIWIEHSCSLNKLENQIQRGERLSQFSLGILC